ncbi:hypothetical protein TNCV_361701 [Trichonephila clavipes]|nr:hypothetical protein TNCV_361701 [Trichonephila clavipes]
MPPLNRVHFRPHSFPTPLEKVELRSRKCLYCNKGDELDTCRSFGAHEKREILRKKGCCFLCLSPGHRAMECVKRSRVLFVMGLTISQYVFGIDMMTTCLQKGTLIM